MHRSTGQLAIAIVILASMALGLSACGASQESNGTSLEVVATTTQVADLVRNVGGDRLDLTQILEPGSDPHAFELRPSAVAAASSADVLFRSGEDLDPWAEQLISESGSDADLVDLSAGLPSPLVGHSAEHDEDAHEHDSEHDPHWWHNPRNALAAVETITEHLSAIDPAGAKAYERNAASYGRRIRQLDRRIEKCMRRLPHHRRKLVTDHEAFSHFANRYELEVAGALFPAMTTRAQPSARDLRELAADIERLDVGAIFPEASLSPKLAEAIADQTGVRVATSLYGDTLGPEGSEGATYLGMMAANAESIAKGLGGEEMECQL